MRSIEDERAARLAAGRVVEKNELIPVLEEYAVTRPEIRVIWLFGSQAEGLARRTSDLDLALQISPPPDPVEEIFYCADRARELEAILGMPVDVVLLSSRLPIPLLWNILKTHTVLYEREPEQAATTGTVLRELCREEWPRVQRRWQRTQEELKERARHAADSA